MSNVIIFAEDWATKLQERLDYNTIWKDICRVEYTNKKVLHNPYKTDASAATHTRGSVYTIQDVVITDEYVTIDSSKIVPQMIDRADLAQTTYTDQMELAESQGQLLDEAIEAYVYGDHASMTNFGDTGSGVLGLSSTKITVTSSNIDDIVRGIKTQIRKANGEKLMARNGAFIVWRPEDLELLEAFCQANGYQMADVTLKDGITQGFRAMGVSHYSSNLLTATHVIAGVKKLYHLGICTDTYGQINIIQDPAGASGGQFSAIGVNSRVDFKGKVWTKVLPVLFDVNVN